MEHPVSPRDWAAPVTERILELSVADDVVEMLGVHSAGDLQGTISAFASATFWYFGAYGAEPNLGMGKTNVLLVFSGTGAKAAKHEL